ncbi:MAG: PAC2 family protein [Phycisphaerales bacterium]|nr:MAG: PAC2 family protein [Phycisphaerales bacterium]
MTETFSFSEQPELENPSLIVGWKHDAGGLSRQVIGHLNRAISAKCFCELDPVRFFSLSGVTIEKNVARFPEGKFYCGKRNDLVTFESNEPELERYEFLNALADLARDHLSIKELYTIGGTVSAIAHTGSRELLAVFNQPQLQQRLAGRGLEDLSWEGSPAISSYLLWVAAGRGIPAVSLWPQVPFYLAVSEDFEAAKVTLSFLDETFELGLDFGGLDDRIKDQNQKISRIREEDPDVEKYISMLESELSLAPEERIELTEKVAAALEQQV